MPTQKVVGVTDLLTSDFAVGGTQREAVSVRISPEAGNRLQRKSNGLYVPYDPPPSAAPRSINPITLTVRNNNVSINQSGSDSTDRHKLLMESDSYFGVINLDFTPRSSSRIELFEIPLDAEIESKYQICFQPHNGGLIWIAPNSRIIIGSDLQRGGRLCVNMTGIFGPPSR